MRVCVTKGVDVANCVLAEADAITASPNVHGVGYESANGVCYIMNSATGGFLRLHPLHYEQRDGVVTLRLENDQVHYTFYATLDAFNSGNPCQSESVPLPEGLNEHLRFIVSSVRYKVLSGG